MPLTITISFPDEEKELFDWLKRQANQSLTVREGLRLIRGQRPPLTREDMVRLIEESIRKVFKELGLEWAEVPPEAEDWTAIEILRRVGR